MLADEPAGKSGKQALVGMSRHSELCRLQYEIVTHSQKTLRQHLVHNGRTEDTSHHINVIVLLGFVYHFEKNEDVRLSENQHFFGLPTRAGARATIEG